MSGPGRDSTTGGGVQPELAAKQWICPIPPHRLSQARR
jgi:hypothetical protein